MRALTSEQEAQRPAVVPATAAGAPVEPGPSRVRPAVQEVVQLAFARVLVCCRSSQEHVDDPERLLDHLCLDRALLEQPDRGRDVGAVAVRVRAPRVLCKPEEGVRGGSGQLVSRGGRGNQFEGAGVRWRSTARTQSALRVWKVKGQLRTARESSPRPRWIERMNRLREEAITGQ